MPIVAIQPMSSALLAIGCCLEQRQQQGQDQELSRKREFLLSWQKEPKPPRRTQADVAEPHRCPVLLGNGGTAPKLAALKQGRLYDRHYLRCSARFMAQEIKS